jgi:hypothetical protein
MSKAISMPVKKRVAKMVGGSLASKVGGASCPPGVWCLDTGLIVLALLVIALVAAVIFIMYRKDSQQQHMMMAAAAKKPTVVVVEKTAPAVVQMQAPADPRFNPAAPEQSYQVGGDLRGFPAPGGRSGGIPINEMTRPPSYPDTYQQVGVLTAPGGTETSGSPTRTILPLFGRKLTTNRDRWNYYTRTDGINPVQVPLQFKRRNCDDDTGCDEITSGDSVGVPILGQSYVANVYRYSTPRYIPY